MAPPITITIPHRLGKAEARVRIEQGFDRLKAQVGGAQFARFQQGWTGDRLDFHAQGLGQTITGRIDVSDTDVRIEVDLPAFLAGIADKIAGRLRKEGRLLLEKK